MGEVKLDPPIKSLMVYNTNPVTQAMDVDKIVKGLQREDLFTVVADHFISDTAAYADIILPATMAAEHDDMMFSWGHFYLTLNQKAIEPSGEACANAEIFRRLAKTMGFTDPEFIKSDKELVESTIDWTAPAAGAGYRDEPPSDARLCEAEPGRGRYADASRRRELQNAVWQVVKSCSTTRPISWHRHFVNCTTRCRVASLSSRFPVTPGHTRVRLTSPSLPSSIL